MNEIDLLESRREVIDLLNAYEGLLTSKQRTACGDYYRYDLSLGEIAEANGTSRAAVFEMISKAVAKMRKYEEALRLVEKRKDIRAMVEAIEKVEDGPTKLELYQQLGKELTDGI